MKLYFVLAVTAGITVASPPGTLRGEPGGVGYPFLPPTITMTAMPMLLQSR